MESLEDLVSSIWNDTRNATTGFRLYHASFMSARLADLSDRLILHFVQEAKEAGLSWTYIGQSLGVSKQAAQQRFGGRSSNEPMFPGVAGSLPWSPEAKEAIQAANIEARAFGHELAGTEHLVLGLLRNPDNSGAKAIRGVGVSLEAVRIAAEGATLPAQDRGEASSTVLTPRAQMVITSLMVKEARRVGHSHVLAEDLLLGILGDEGGIGAAILADAGIEYSAIIESLS
jgi:hypothetical protein